MGPCRPMAHGLCLHTFEKSQMPWKKEHKRIAYAIQTSGTMGEPKTVHVPYSAIMPNIDDFV